MIPPITKLWDWIASHWRKHMHDSDFQKSPIPPHGYNLSDRAMHRMLNDLVKHDVFVVLCTKKKRKKET